MDPVAAVIAVYDAIHENDVLEANHRFNDLQEWIDRGGFVPASYEDVRRDLESLNIETEEMISEATMF